MSQNTLYTSRGNEYITYPSRVHIFKGQKGNNISIEEIILRGTQYMLYVAYNLQFLYFYDFFFFFWHFHRSCSPSAYGKEEIEQFVKCLLLPSTEDRKHWAT